MIKKPTVGLPLGWAARTRWDGGCLLWTGARADGYAGSGRAGGGSGRTAWRTSG